MLSLGTMFAVEEGVNVSVRVGVLSGMSVSRRKILSVDHGWHVIGSSCKCAGAFRKD